MKSLQYRFSIPNYLTVRAIDRYLPPLLASGRIPGLALVDTAPKALPGDEWLRLRPRLCGICGSDISLLTNRGSPALTPFISFPLVPGHEIVADTVAVGPAVADIAPGQRVMVDPLISCQMRGLDPCRSCARGEAGLCLHAAEGHLSPGMLTGFCRDLPGGWGEDMVVHRSQVYPVPDGMPDEKAVLVEPLSVALHAVLKCPPRPENSVLIVGGGTVGLLVLAALRLLGLSCHVTLLARHAFQATLAERLGADLALRGGHAGEAAIRATGARKYQPIRGRPVYAGGFDRVYDCVGSASSLDDCLRVAGPHARVILVGCAAQLPRIDFTFVWARELQLMGSYVYGQESSIEGTPHTFQLAMDLLSPTTDYPLAALVTHRFPLVRWQEAMRASLQREKHSAVKVVFDFRNSSERPSLETALGKTTPGRLE